MREEYERAMVSVIVPAYNRAHFIADAMDSVWAQTHRPVELIVVDDGSTDATDEVLEQWRRKHAADRGFVLRSFRQSNRGAPAARNLGLIESRGEFIQFLDSDDILAPRALSELVAGLLTHADAGLVYGDWIMGPSVDSAMSGSLGPKDDMVVALLSEGWVVPFAYLVRRQVFTQIAWDETIRIRQDLDLFLRIAARGFEFQHVGVPCGLYRQGHANRVSRQTTSIWAKNTARILRNVEHSLQSGDVLTPQRAWALAHCYLVIGRESFRDNPSFFRWARTEMLRVCPGFRPRNTLYRIAVTLCGYEVTQRMVNAGRYARRRLQRLISCSAEGAVR